MAKSVGFWNKVKNLFTKAWSGMKKGAKWLNDTLVKPIIQPALKTIAPAIPYGSLIERVVDSGSKITENITSEKPNYSKVFSDISKQVGIGLGPNKRIKFKT